MIERRPRSSWVLMVFGLCFLTSLAVWLWFEKQLKVFHSSLVGVVPISYPKPNTTLPEPEQPTFVFKIPHRLIFTSKHNILERKNPTKFYDNIQRTIQLYRKAWGEPNAPVWFLNDTECRDVIREANSTLLEYFDKESIGKYRADMCRVAALFLKGGYYFDIDIEVVEPVLLSSTTTFSTCETDGMVPRQFFQAFLATEPQNPILKQTFSEIVGWYMDHGTYLKDSGGDIRTLMMGTTTLRRAFDNITVSRRGQVHLLHEIDLTRSAQYSLERHHGKGCCCNYVVHDPFKKKVHFFSRFVGAGSNCMELT